MVTGANSLLGANVITALLAEGYAVRGMVRRPETIPLRNENIEEFVGILTNPSDVREAVSGCDIVIHIAANTVQNSIRDKDYATVNVAATKYVLEAAREWHIRKTIIVSSANAFGYGTIDSPGTEATPIAYPFTKSCYAKSKKEAQDFALQYSGKGIGEIVVVNPTFMIGKYDSKPSSGKIITMNYKRKFIFIPPGGKNFIHVKDVATAICNAIVFGKDRQCYLLANENLTYRAFYTKLNEVTGVKRYIITLPKWFLRMAGMAGSCFIRMGIPNVIHYNNMRILCVKNYYGSQKAVQELKMPLTPLSVAISDAVEWFSEKNIL